MSAGDVPEEWRGHLERAPDRNARPYAWLHEDGGWRRHAPDPARGSDPGTPVETSVRYFLAACQATWELYRRHGWEPLVLGPLPGHGVSGCEQTELTAALASRGHPAAVDGAIAGVTRALEEITAERAALRLFPAPSPSPAVSGGLAFR